MPMKYGVEEERKKAKSKKETCKENRSTID
jgi:hypothetical protein